MEIRKGIKSSIFCSYIIVDFNFSLHHFLETLIMATPEFGH